MPAIARWSRSSACSRRDSRRRISPSSPRRGRAPPGRGGRAPPRRLRREEPDAGALLLRVLGQDELRAADELERERRASSAPSRLPGGTSAVPPSSGGRAGRARRRRSGRGAACRAARRREAPALERRERRVERLQRRDVRRAGFRDRERRDRVRQLSPPRLHLRQFRHRRPRYRSCAAASRAGRATRRSRCAQPTKSVVRKPIVAASTPPSRLPRGITPQTIQRRDAFMRPSMCSGTSVWYRLMPGTLKRTMPNDDSASDATMNTIARLCGASGQRKRGAPPSAPPRASVPPVPRAASRASRRRRRGASRHSRA